MKILITGGAGFIGSHLVDALIQERHRVIVIDNLSTGLKQNLNPKVKFYKIDICSRQIKSIFKKEKPKVVFHLAAQIDVRKSIENPVLDTKINVLGGLNILECARQCGVKKIIFSSSGGAIYGKTKIIPTPETVNPNPLSPYGLNKLIFERYLQLYSHLYGLNYSILRYANVYGPRQNAKAEAGVIAIFINKLLHNKQPVINGDGKQTRDYIYVDDVIRANLMAMKSKNNGVYNIGTGIETSVNQIFKIISQSLNKKIKPKYGPTIKGEVKRSALNWNKIKKDFGWQFRIKLEEGIGKTIDWFKKLTK